jgi:hypothetical protein
MGFNSVILICNDAVCKIEDDPKGWWKKAWSKLSELTYGKTKTFGHGNHGNAFQAVWNQHADFTGVIMVGQNGATVFGSSLYGKHHTEEGQLKILKEILRDKGYTIRKLSKN